MELRLAVLYSLIVSHENRQWLPTDKTVKEDEAKHVEEQSLPR